MKICISLLEKKSLEDEEIDDEFQDDAQKGVLENQLRNHFLVYTLNPLKICIIVIDLLTKVRNKYPFLDHGHHLITERYKTIFSHFVSANGKNFIRIKQSLEGNLKFTKIDKAQLCF